MGFSIHRSTGSRWVAACALLISSPPSKAAPQSVPSAQAAPASVECPGLDYGIETGLAGLVRGADETVTIPKAVVIATWVDEDGARNTRSAEAGPDGAYVMCGLPVDTRLAVRAGFADYASSEATVRIEPGPPAGWDFEIDVDEGALRGDASLPGRIVGTVVDRATGRPVEAAELELVGDRRTRLTDGSGRFSFSDLAPGVYRVAVTHLTYDRVEQMVSVPGNRTVELRFGVSANPIELEPIVVSVVRERRLELRGYYARRDVGEKVGNGVFFDEREIARLMPSRVTNLLQWVPGVRVDCRGGPRNCQVIMTHGNPSLSSRAESGCVNANVWVDGVRVIRDNSATPESIDSFVSPSDISALEVYRSASEVPGEFSGSVGRCGAIVIWTRSG